MTRLRKQVRGGAVHKSSPTRLRRRFRVGDRVRIVEIAEYLKDSNYDLKDEGHREMRTAELFRFCVGREFTIKDFDEYGHAEIDASKNHAVRNEFGKYHTIWSEPKFLELLRSVENTRKSRKGALDVPKGRKKI